MAYLSGYTTRRKITIDHTKVDSTLTDFPVLVKLTSTNFDFAKANSDGFDIRFTSSDGTTLLKYERERYDSTNSLAEYWVKIPSVSSTADTDFYVYYRTTDTADGADPTNAWDTNFKGVWHMNQDPSGTAPQELDSTSNNNDGTSGGSMTSTDLVEGQVDGALDFDGSDDYINVGDQANLEVARLTLSFWVKTNDYTRSLNGGVAKGDIFGSGQGFSYKLDFHDSNARASVSNSSNTAYEVDVGIGDNNWHLWTLIYDGQNVSLYKDDAFGNSASFTGDIDYTKDSNYFAIGGRPSGSYALDGLIDEVRVSDSARSADWIKASYNSGADTLNTYGSEETAATDNAIMFGANF